MNGTNTNEHLPVRFSPSGWFGGFVLLFIDLIFLFLHTQNAIDWKRKRKKKGKHTQQIAVHCALHTYYTYWMPRHTGIHGYLKLHANHLRHEIANSLKNDGKRWRQQKKERQTIKSKPNQTKGINRRRKRRKTIEKNNDGWPANMRFWVLYCTYGT